LALAVLPFTRADVVTDWNAAFEASLLNPSERGPRVPIRTWAIMHAAMFDAVNGIVGKYQPCHVTESAPPGARAEAAAIQAAYTTLSTLRPAFQSAYDAQLESSLAGLAGDQGNSQSIARGRAWGEYVAQQIIAWRANDGSAAVLPPFVGSTAAGYWRHAPLGAAPNAGLANLVTAPFALANLPMFDPGPPYGFADRTAALQSAAYAADVNEAKERGGVISSVRTAEQTAHALFNHACDGGSLNQLLRSLVSPKAQLVENARAFALLNMAPFDAGIAIFRAKYQYSLWRPFQAINYANEVPNAAITQDATWASMLPTPSHPEYPSAHLGFLTSGLQVIARLVGDTGPVEFSAPTFAPRTYASLAAISDATIEARIYLGFHYREAGEAGQVIGRAVGDYIVDHALRPQSASAH
jgi:hypothetical protein